MIPVLYGPYPDSSGAPLARGFLAMSKYHDALDLVDADGARRRLGGRAAESLSLLWSCGRCVAYAGLAGAPVSQVLLARDPACDMESLLLCGARVLHGNSGPHAWGRDLLDGELAHAAVVVALWLDGDGALRHGLSVPAAAALLASPGNRALPAWVYAGRTLRMTDEDHRKRTLHLARRVVTGQEEVHGPKAKQAKAALSRLIDELALANL